MAYTPTNWTNFPSTATPVSASNLNKIENELVALDTDKADESAVTTALAEKVDKEPGKGLSTNDFDNTYKDKLDGISEQANKVEITPVVTEGTTLATISIDGVDTAIKGSDIEVDDEMSPTSTNPVQNKVIYDTLQNILPEGTAEGNPIGITDASGLNAKSCEVSFSPIQSGSGEPSPENVRPISGWDSLILTRTGKNLFDKSQKDTSKGYVDNSYLFTDGEISSNNNYYISEYIAITPNTYYAISGLRGDRVFACWYGADKTYIGQQRYSNNESRTFTTPSNAYYLRISVYKDNEDITQLELGTTATAYEPYNGQTHTATFPSTIYGGSHEFVSGKLKSELDIVDLSTLSWNYDSSGKRWQTSGLTTIKSFSTRSVELVSDRWKADITAQAGDEYKMFTVSKGLYFYTTDSVNSPIGTLVYPLETPLEITLTPETIELLKGNNTLWTDGDNITLKYSADIKEWVLAQLQS